MSSSKIKTFLKYLKNGEGLYILFAKMGLKKNEPDEVFLKHVFKANLGYKLDLDNPKTFNEKLQWLKLFYRNPICSVMVDKYEVKEYVAKSIGQQYVIPTLGVWDRFDDIDFNKLPNQFVIKCTHDSGGVFICRSKQTFNYKVVRKRINNSLKTNYFYQNREWPYKNVRPRIIAEAYVEDSDTKELRDYKFFCFDGKVKALFIATDRGKKGTETKFDFFDRDFNHLSIFNGHPNAPILPQKPKNFEKMIELAEQLTKGFPHLRCDFYEADGKILFGELTFFHWGGFVPFVPDEWDKIFGSWINLPDKNKD